jgi:methylenetetrahydrofolate dehydrogenase (NADP+)/methenyltetrahydrofolate cyclohydrolase
MTATVMDGKGLSGSIRAIVKGEVERLEGFAKPSLATVLVGSDEASDLYVSLKHRACQEVGIRSMDYRFPDGTPEGRVIEKIEELNRDDGVHGILVQLPLPASMGVHRVMERIRPEKDVDGLNPRNLGLTMYQEHGMLPCTPAGILTLLSHYSVDLRGKHAVIINRSPDVGKPLTMLLLNRDATVTVCHSKTIGINGHASSADILVSAVGCRPDFIVGEGMVKTGAVVIDAGTNRIGGRVYGDVDFERVVHKASYITPVPGGVGPMTVAMLLRNTLVAASIQARVGLSDLFTYAPA